MDPSATIHESGVDLDLDFHDPFRYDLDMDGEFIIKMD